MKYFTDIGVSCNRVALYAGRPCDVTFWSGLRRGRPLESFRGTLYVFRIRTADSVCRRASVIPLYNQMQSARRDGQEPAVAPYCNTALALLTHSYGGLELTGWRATKEGAMHDLVIN